MNTLENISDEAEIISNVNILIEESGLSPAGEPKALLKTLRKKTEPGICAPPCPKCGLGHVVKNGSANEKSSTAAMIAGSFPG